MQVTTLYTWIFDETALSRFWLFLLGAHIGKNVSVEEPYLLEPDLVHIGDDCVAEFEVQFATAEIRHGYLEFRTARIGNRVKLGARSILLGGAHVHDGCEVGPKATVDFYSSTTQANQILVGSPAKPDGQTSGELWRPKRGILYTICQFTACILQLFLFACVVYAGISTGLVILDKYGSMELVVYIASAFNVIASFTWLVLMVILRRVLIPFIVPGKVYSSSWFALRKWFLDRLFLSPLYAYTAKLALQTSSTLPWYMQLLGARVGKKAWLNHPYIRVGVELIEIGDNFRAGMLSYISTCRHSKDGVSFHPIRIGNDSSFGQRCVILGGSTIGDSTTAGAESLIPYDFHVNEGGTTFGCPPVVFTTSASHKDVVQQTQEEAGKTVKARKEAEGKCNTSCKQINLADTEESKYTPTRMQDFMTGCKFWVYVTAMIIIQLGFYIVAGGAYGGFYYAFTVWLGELRLEYLIGVIPIIYLMGSLVLMLILKIMQSLGGGFSVGTAEFFSLRMFYWNVFADLVYMCTSTIIYPFSGTQLYCMWLRFMGAKVGKRVFASPENGGFREIDFLDIGDDVVLMTPNIHAHFSTHGMLQFCPVKLEDGVEINPGATIMPLTQYGKGCRLRPFAVTVKGQVYNADTEYIGNPCKIIRAQATKRVAILFPGQGSQYPGMYSSCLEEP